MFYKYKKIILYFKKCFKKSLESVIPDPKILDLTTKINPKALDYLKYLCLTVMPNPKYSGQNASIGVAQLGCNIKLCYFFDFFDFVNYDNL
jgi:hypothetical protein